MNRGNDDDICGELRWTAIREGIVTWAPVQDHGIAFRLFAGAALQDAPGSTIARRKVRRVKDPAPAAGRILESLGASPESEILLTGRVRAW